MSTNLRAPRVLIVVEGGVVQGVSADGAVEILIKDFDDIEADPSQFDPGDFRRPTILSDAEFKAAVVADTHLTPD